MSSLRFSRLCRLLSLGAAAWLPGLAADWQGLVEKSPFGQPATNLNVNAPGQELEFRGLVEDNGTLLVNLYDPARRSSRWVEVNSQESGLEIKGYDAASNTVQIVKDGRPLTLALKQARVTLVAAPVPAAAEPPRVEGADPAQNAGPNEPRRTAASNGGRLDNAGPNAMRNLPPEAQAIIQEIRRRRAERAGNRPAMTPPPPGN